MGNGSLDRSEPCPYDSFQRTKILGSVRIEGREDRKTGVAVGHEGEKGGEGEEDILPVGGKLAEVGDLKKYHKMS